MAELTLNRVVNDFGNGNEGIVIKKAIHGLEGGKALDFTGYGDDYIQEGHGIILDGGDYKPQPVNGTEHSKLVGVARSLTTKLKPSCGIMTMGVINNGAAKYTFNAASLAALQVLGIQNQLD